MTLIRWQPRDGQGRIHYGYNGSVKHCVRTYGRLIEWMAFIDVDEFIFSPTDVDIRERLGAMGVKEGNRFGAPPKNAEESLPLLSAHMSDDFIEEPAVALPKMHLSEHVAEDYAATGLSLKAHPISFFRDELSRLGAMRNIDHRDEKLRENSIVTVSGLVLIRQRPGTAKVVFITLEDETGIANIIVWPHVFQRHRRLIMTSRFMAVRGRLQRAGLVIHVLAESFIDLTPHLARLRQGDIAFSEPIAELAGEAQAALVKSRDFH